MTENVPSNPHDRFFRAAFSRPAVMGGLLQAYLPESLLQALAPETLRLHKDTFIEKELADFRSDLLYEITWRDTGEPLYIYLLLEHKSRPDRLVGLQLHKYSHQIWIARLEQHKAPGKPRFLPVIIPLVLYHGTEPWPFLPQFGDLQRPQAAMLEPFRQKFEHLVCDLSGMSAWELKADLITRLVLRALRNIFRPDVREGLLDTLSVAAEIAGRQTVLEIVEMVLRYFVQVHQVGEPVIREVLTFIGGPQLMETFFDRYDRYAREAREEGMQQGMKQGMQKFGQSLLKSQLASRFGTLPGWAAQRLTDADCTQLEVWGKRLLEAGSLEAVFEEKR